MGAYHKDFMSGLPRSLRGHDTVWIVVDCLTKSTHFLPICLSNLVEYLGVIYVRKIIQLQEVLVSIVSNRDCILHNSFGRG